MNAAETSPQWKPWHFWAFLGFTVALAFFTFFWRYWQPPYVFWDENYHIASAQKYIHGVYFMEQHPPLGKLLIALGEVLIHPNERTDQFLGTDYGTDFPAGFSFAGYRFFSALLSWLAAPLFFLIFYWITRKNPLTACLLTFLYIFDTALIVHSRGAMLEGPLLFFTALLILSFFWLYDLPERTGKFLGLSAMFGIALALALTTKVLSLIFILFIPPLLWRMRKNLGRAGAFLGVAFAAFLLVYCTVWEIHFALGKTINPSLPDAGYYQASPQYKTILATGRTSSPFAFPALLRDSLKFVSHYNNGAPRLDLCKADENGSPWFFWPLGARTINYRWETPGDGNYRYLYLVPNPAVWWPALLGLVFAGSMLLAHVFFPPKRPLQRPFLIAVFLGMYLCFFIAISQIDRVLYLYHYFLPLQLSFILFALVFAELQTIGKRILSPDARTIGLIVLAGAIFLGFLAYRPFAYYQPMSDAAVQRRAILPLWELHCVNCSKESLLVVPSK